MAKRNKRRSRLTPEQLKKMVSTFDAKKVIKILAAEASTRAVRRKPPSKILLQFDRLDGDTEDVAQKYHVFIKRTWQHGPDDLHIQFENGMNYFPTYDEKLGFYQIRHKDRIYNMGGMAIDTVPDKGSIELDPEELKRFWTSPNETDYGMVDINGKSHAISSKELTFDQVFMLAYPGKPVRNYSCTYYGARGPKSEGILAPGQSIRVGKQMRISIMDTSNA